ncbi:hypothetical protein [Bacillus safensis]|uniref:hypothetical protein n=1 Tax=Bacillus safensis TaxID=561879 RepID=UPI00380EC67E|nr:hypothetical protein [Bacillus safensis]
MATATSEDLSLHFELFDQGLTSEINGKFVYVDHLKKEFRIKDDRGDTNYIRFMDYIKRQNSMNMNKVEGLIAKPAPPRYTNTVIQSH